MRDRGLIYYFVIKVKNIKARFMRDTHYGLITFLLEAVSHHTKFQVPGVGYLEELVRPPNDSGSCQSSWMPIKTRV